MQITPHFSFEELTDTTHTDLLEQNRIDAKKFMKQLKYNAGALEEVRAILGVPLKVSSGFRYPVLNKRVGGSDTSTHQDGTTSDAVPVGMSVNEAFNKIVDNINQLKSVKKIILENVNGKNWLHIEAKTKIEEKLVLYTTTDGKNYSRFIV